ncbi:calcium-binding protein [Zavarzinia aquatilis]|uniref:Calcium-binding protein n=1 Tax=Zavarzinia aquatilis TaxID=2211142 RepID=A0A317DZH5_9PROT|nr:calcium-binding protein [Zavarzinia aquatilis]PWR20198.1 hypothetical protein DKG74_16080 [Zavarzinia aquatilis]
MAIVNGTNKANTLTGTDAADEINGEGGNDVLIGGEGSDALDGGGGNDTAVYEGPRSRYIVYADPWDTYYVVDTLSVAGKSSTDSLWSIEYLQFSDGQVSTTATATALGQLIHVDGDRAEEEFATPTYTDLPIATDGNDSLEGGTGYDVIAFGRGEDFVDGGAGNDIIEGYGAEVVKVADSDTYTVVGSDNLKGGAGDDEIFAGYGAYVDGGAGYDLVHLELIVQWEHWVAHSILATANTLGLNVDLRQADAGTVALAIGGLGNITVTLKDIERFEITFGSGADTVTGGEGDDELHGDSYNFPGGDDLLHGAGGHDVLNGQDGSDRLYGDAGNDTLDGGTASPGYDDDETDFLFGGDGDDSLIGRRGDNLDGGSGYDTATLLLWASDFSYAIDLSALSAPDTPLVLGDGTSVVRVERITQISFGSGSDKSLGTSQADEFWGDAGDDALYGRGGSDLLFGETGNDILNGGAGVDKMYGGAGNDIYYVDEINDVVDDDEGTDTVRSTATDYTLPDGVDNLALIGAENINGSGNYGSNILTGNAGNNYLFGLAGKDTLIGGNGDDLLDGGTSTDVMRGGRGSDIYIVDNAGDVIEEVSGTDTVQTKLTIYTLTDGIENLVFTVGRDNVGFGNAAANTVTGNSKADDLSGLDGNDILSGGAGNDTLRGGAGADLLKGGAGADRFVFDMPGDGADQIDDFSFGDLIVLDRTGFGIAPESTLALTVGGSSRGLQGDRLYYHDTTGRLFWHDGETDTLELIAKIAGKPVLRIEDFALV